MTRSDILRAMLRALAFSDEEGWDILHALYQRCSGSEVSVSN